MTTIVVLFLIGVLLLALEIVVPGAILGIVGGLFLLGGVGVAFAHFGGTGGALALTGAVALLGVTVYAELVWLPKSWLAKHFSMATTLDGTSQPPLARNEEVVGQTAVAQTVLAPTGYVQIAGRRYEAYSQSGHAEVGAQLRVVGLDNFRVIVRKV
ncbi:MAG: NfeD family protein [Opitutae bacterium]|nr:NfeD family protein [Opitutae bacterium]